MNNIKNILVIKWGALGDLVAATTAIRAVREGFPNARITLLSNSLMYEICPPGTLADDIIPYNKNMYPLWDWLVAHVQLIRTLRRKKFDAAVNLRWESERSALLTWLSGAQYRVGSGPKSMRFVYNIRAPFVEGRHHEFHRHVDIVQALGIHPFKILPFVYYSHDDLRFAQEFFSRNNLNKSTTIGIHPGASKESKAWPLERYAELARRLVDELHLNVVVTWGPGEESLAQHIAQQSQAYITLPTTIGKLAAIIASLGLFVCNYSGSMNIAIAVETPMIALGATSPEDWGPYGDSHRTINKAHEKDSYTDEEQLAVMKEISVEEVLRLCVQRLRELYHETYVEAR